MGGLAKCEHISVLMGHVCFLLHLYVLPCASMKFDLGVLAGLVIVPSK